jgi:hypothetical protein
VGLFLMKGYSETHEFKHRLSIESLCGSLALLIDFSGLIPLPR